MPIGTSQKAMSGAMAKAKKNGTLGVGFGGEPSKKSSSKKGMKKVPKVMKNMKMPSMQTIKKSVRKTMGY